MDSRSRHSSSTEVAGVGRPPVPDEAEEVHASQLQSARTAFQHARSIDRELEDAIARNAVLEARIAQLSDELAQAHLAAYHDDLTGLPNRRLLADRLEQAIASGRRTGQRVAVLMLDIDRFKEINDRHGHATGDAVLQEVACRLRRALRASDTSCRVGGDEFVLILPDVGDEHGVNVALDKIAEALAAPYRLASRSHVVTASVGIACFPDDGATGDELLLHADRSMYQRKSNAGPGRAPRDECAARPDARSDAAERPHRSRA